MLLLFMTIIVCNIGTKKVKERTKTTNLIVDYFSSNFVNISLAWMLYFLLEPQQSNLSNPEAYFEPYQTSKMECFAKIVYD